MRKSPLGRDVSGRLCRMNEIYVSVKHRLKAIAVSMSIIRFYPIVDFSRPQITRQYHMLPVSPANRSFPAAII